MKSDAFRKHSHCVDQTHVRRTKPPSEQPPSKIMNTLSSLHDNAPSGCYYVSESSYLILERSNTAGNSNCSVDNADVESMFQFMYSLPPLPNPRRPTTFLKRPQVTFSPINYDFGQKTTTFPYDENVPNLIKTSKKIVEGVLSKHGFEKEYNGAHVSMYPDGSAGLDPHEDDEPVIDQSVPIASISFGETRKFAFYRKQTADERNAQIQKSKAKVTPDPKPVKISSVALNHGDVAIMVNMQTIDVLHGIVKEPKLTNPRINITYRNFVAI